LLETGKSYQINELIERMIKYSDNNSWYLLYQYLDKINYNPVKIFKDINLNYNLMKSDIMMSVKEYSSFFRILFNASYLNREMSEKALALLSYTDFKNGIRSSIPPNIIVASKYGDRETGINFEIKQIHEFGIIYYPKKPYLLGIMTRGKDLKKLVKVLQDISLIVYKEIDTQIKGSADKD